MNNKNNYFCGVDIGEQKVGRSLKRKGAEVKFSPGSRGAFDLTAKGSTGKSWGVQVKTTCDPNSKPKMPPQKEIKRMIKMADAKGITPVIALVHPNKNTQYIYAKTGKKASF